MGKKTFKSKFQRFETKYVVSKEKLAVLQEAFQDYLVSDDYATSTISNLYYDTEQYQMIRESLEKPYFKEKLRMRSYAAQPTNESEAFLEIKKKVRKVVYKRRISTTVASAQAYLTQQKKGAVEDSQIKSEIDWLRSRYGYVKPMMYIYYDRYSMKGIEDSDVRITIDHNILYRDYDLDLTHGVYGEHLLPEDHVIMEVKVPGAYPIWLSQILDEQQVYPSSFSKYGVAYKTVSQKGVKHVRTAI